MLDLALSSQGELWGVSAKNAYKIVVQGTTAHCAVTTPLSVGTGIALYGLSFVPPGVLDPSLEVLVGADGSGNVWSINTVTGILTQHGSFGLVPATDGHGHAYANAGKPWELSGDIVFKVEAGSPVGFATVHDCPNPPSMVGCSATDTLLRLDTAKMATATTGSITLAVLGQAVKQATCADSMNTSYGKLFGLAESEGTVYGFSRTGGVVTLSEVDGSACMVRASADLWAGAAIAPLAP
jgi:hypothetical protein